MTCGCRQSSSPDRSGAIVPFASPLRFPFSFAEASPGFDVADRIGAVPTGRDLFDVLEESSLGATDVGYLDHGTGMGLCIEIAEAALLAADLALVPDLVA